MYYLALLTCFPLSHASRTLLRGLYGQNTTRILPKYVFFSSPVHDIYNANYVATLTPCGLMMCLAKGLSVYFEKYI